MVVGSNPAAPTNSFFVNCTALGPTPYCYGEPVAKAGLALGLHMPDGAEA